MNTGRTLRRIVPQRRRQVSRDFQAEVNADECHRVHESYELKWAGERDADEYCKKAAKERRGNPDELIAKDKEILAASEKLAKKEKSHAEIEIQARKAARRKI